MIRVLAAMQPRDHAYDVVDLELNGRLRLPMSPVVGTRA
jgi:hypothetical protein